MIEVIKNFIIQYCIVFLLVLTIFELISCCILFILSLIRLLLSDFNKSPYIKEFVMEKLPAVINIAEKMFNDGKDKKSYVLDTIINCIRDHFPKVNSSLFRSFISGAIEKYLSTPQKKEDK